MECSAPKKIAVEIKVLYVQLVISSTMTQKKVHKMICIMHAYFSLASVRPDTEYSTNLCDVTPGGSSEAFS